MTDLPTLPASAFPPTWEEFQRTQFNTDHERLAQLEKEPGFARDPASGRIVSGTYGTDAQTMVKFTKEKVWSRMRNWETKGEDPFVELEFITIMPSGPASKELTKHSVVQAFDIWRFPKEYEAFKNGLVHGREGTPLSKWKLMAGDKALINELEQASIYTVEQLASASDSSAPYLRSFYTWKQAAQKYVENNKKSNADVALEEKLAEMQAAHDKKIAEMTETMNKLLALVEKPTKAKG